MIIHVVQPGDTIYTIAQNYGVSVERLILDNDLFNVNDLVTGQTIVVVYPLEIHIVQPEETLEGIANTYGVTVLQLLRNNPYLSDRTYLYAGETIVISYDTGRSITTNGFAFPYIDETIIRKTLPFLTCLSIFNYTITGKGDIISYKDDTELIETTKAYKTIPLMMISSFFPTGSVNLDTVYEILLNEDTQNHFIQNVIDIIKQKGYYGINIAVNYMNTTNQKLYQVFIEKLSNRFRPDNLLVFLTVNPNFSNTDSGINFERIDYNKISPLVNNITFLNYLWGTNFNPPSPVYSYSNMRMFLDYAVTKIPTDIISVGTPLLGYKWELPYTSQGPGATSLTINSALSLAHDINKPIDFDEISQTPYFHYDQLNFDVPVENIVWFIDARTIESVARLVSGYSLSGTGLWNVMIFYTQMWLIINTQFEIEKLLD